MARRSALPYVLGQMIPVYPKGGQPPYYRSKRSIQTSARLKRYQSCVAEEMRNKTFPNRRAVREAFKAAAHKCRGS